MVLGSMETIQDINLPATYWRVLRKEWMGMEEWDDYETSDEMDHSRKFPAFSTSKVFFVGLCSPI